MLGLRTLGPLGLDVFETHLHRVVSVSLGRLDLQDAARAGLNDRDRVQNALVVVDLSHDRRLVVGAAGPADPADLGRDRPR